MRLKSLVLNNFKGIKSFTFEPDCKNAAVFGDNATGKTTIADAQCWLLFDKDSKGTPNFSPKTKDDAGEDIHNLEHSVEGIYQLSDGTLITFKKVIKEDWKTKRGSNTETFSGHTTDYFVDKVPCKEKEYTDKLLAIASVSNMMMLSLPLYFSEKMSMQERRQKLLDIVGDMNDYEIIGSNDKIKELADYLRKPLSVSQFYSVDEYEKIARASLKEINTKIKDIPGRIDEATKAIPVIDFSEEELDEQLSKLHCDKQILEIKLNSTNSEQTAELNAKIAELKTQLANAETEHIKSNQNIYKDIDNEISSLSCKSSDLNNQLMQLNFKKQNTSNELTHLISEREKVLDRYSEVEKTVWNDNTICPSCGQSLPKETIQQSKEKYKLIELNEYGKQNCSKDMIAEREKTLATLDSQIAEMKAQCKSCEDTITALREKRSTISAPNFNATVIFKEINAQIDNLTYELVKLQKGLSTGLDEVKAQVSELNDKIRDCVDKKSKIDLAKKQKERISELEKEEKKLGVESEKTQKGIYLCEEFIRTKVSLLDNKINGLFKTVKFRLFIQQINGGIKEDCEVLVPSESGLVPFSFANNAARINAGLEIISALSEHLNFIMPVFVDNAESVTRLNDSDLQIIKLVVNEVDKVLRVKVLRAEG